MTGGRGITSSAVLLAGGESRRMGRDKATIEFDSHPLWERQLELLRALEPERLLVSARTKPDWLPPGAELLLDDPPSRGPLSGLTKALAAIGTTHLIALAIDMPLLTAGQIRELLSHCWRGCGVVPTIRERAEPLAAIYPVEAANDFAAALGGSDFSLQTLIKNLAAASLVQLSPVGDESVHLYRSVNSPGDFKEFTA